MSLVMTKSGKFNNSETKLNFIEIAWENLMNECLLNKKIFKNSEKDYEECSRFDPNFVMNMRHKMFQQSSEMFLISKMQIHSEALKILRLENHNRLLQKKESKIIEKEITKLKQTLENHRLLTEKAIDETNPKKVRLSSNIPKFAKHYPKLPKELEYSDVVYKINGFLNQHVHMTTESKINQQKISLDTKALLKNQRKKQTEEILESVFNYNNGITEFNTENEKHSLKIIQRNNETMEKIFEKNTEGLIQESLNDTIEKFKIRKEIEIQNKINQKLLECAWRTWKAFTQRLKNRRRVKTIYTYKIESFLSYLQEKGTRQEKTKYLKRVTRLKHKIKTNHTLENQEKATTKQTIREEKEEKLKKLMQAVKASQADTQKKLKEIAKSNSKCETKFSNPKFLQKIEKRRQERIKRKKEIQEEKLKLKEEKEKERIENEEKKKQEEKKIRLEELRKRRRLEKVKKLEQKERREKLRLNRELAENYHKIYLLRVYGWRPWAMLLKVRDLQYQQAVVFCERKVTQKVFNRWMAYVKEHVKIAIVNAENFYKNALKKKYLLIWKKLLVWRKSQDQAATDWNEYKIIEKAFKKWLQFTQNEILEYLNKKEMTKLFYERKLKEKSLKKIRGYPNFIKLEQAKEMRKRRWRQKIKEILPDYQPVDVSQ